MWKPFFPVCAQDGAAESAAAAKTLPAANAVIFCGLLPPDTCGSCLKNVKFRGMDPERGRDMRIAEHPAPEAQGVFRMMTIRYNGEPVQAPAGEPLAAGPDVLSRKAEP